MTRRKPTGAASLRMLVPIVVTPRAVTNEIGPVEAGRLRVRVTAAPADGQANEAVRRLIGAELDVAPRDVTVVSGAGARRKLISIVGPTAAEIDARWPGLGPEPGA